jgi:hypothetical protein
MSHLVSTSAVKTSRVVQRFDFERCLAPLSPTTGLQASEHRCLPTAQAGAFSGASR